MQDDDNKNGPFRVIISGDLTDFGDFTELWFSEVLHTAVYPGP